MIPAPLLVIIRSVVIYACGKAAGHGWDFFNWGADTTDAVVQVIAMILAAGVTSIGAIAATVRRRVAHLVARHPAALLDAAAAVPGVTKIEATPALAAATVSPAVVAPAQPGGA